MAVGPLSAEELLDRCDLAGVARVISVGRATSSSPNIAELDFVRFYKGSAPNDGGRVRVRLHGGAHAADGRLVRGSWSDWWDYPAGALVETHLAWNAARQVYETSWPAAVSEIERESVEVA